MSRVKQVSLFWAQKEPTLESMILRGEASLVDGQERQEVCALLPDLHGKKVVELASGIGRYTRYVSERAAHLTTVDLIPKFVEKNRQDHSDCLNVEYVCSDVMSLKIADDSCDFIFFNWLLMYLTDKEGTILLQRIYRWLKPEGELFFRESCDLKRKKSRNKEYYVNYRTASYYDDFIKNKFVVLNSGYLKTYIDFYGNPFQEFWHCLKRPAVDALR